MNTKKKQERGPQEAVPKPNGDSLSPQHLLKDGLRLHRAGSIIDATEIYRSVLNLDPYNAECIQLLGVAQMQLGETTEAINLIKRSISINPKNSQAHYNLGLALGKIGKQQKSLAAFRRAIAAEPKNYEAHNAIGGILLSLNDQNDLAEVHIRKAINLNPVYAPALNNMAMLLKAQKNFIGALEQAERALENSAGEAFIYQTLASIFKNLGQLEKAKEALLAAISFAPNNSQAHSDLGAVLKSQGLLAEAKKEFDLAVEIDPNNTQALNGLASLLVDQGIYPDATNILEKILRINVSDISALYSLGTIFRRESKWSESIACFRRILDIDETDLFAAQAFADSLHAAHYIEADDQILTDIERCLRIEGISHESLYGPAVRIVRDLDSITSLVKLAQHDQLVLTATDVKKGDILKPLSTAFFCRLLERNVLPDWHLEILLTAIRHSLLILAVEGRLPEQLHSDTLNFICALGQQCFLNEYVYSLNDDEIRLADSLASQISERLHRPDDPLPRAAISVLSCYMSLNTIESSNLLENHDRALANDSFGKLITTQIRNVKTELKLEQDINQFSSIKDKTSGRVREQYESSPYPRWSNVARIREKPVLARLGGMFPHANLRDLEISETPNILVAGCGTGASAITAALRYTGAKVFALDLSLASLSYGKRKAIELGINTVEWNHGDILDLGLYEGNFDIIECAGVLHHMENPVHGWEVLRNILKPGGVMKVGLYSELGRTNIVNRGSEVLKLGKKTIFDHIRQFRKDIYNLQDDVPLKKITSLHDFYTLSECRDLIFHSEEHRFSLLQLALYIKNLGMEFLGFEMKDGLVLESYRKQYPSDIAANNLENWHNFEINNPDTFIGMYQFWLKLPDHQVTLQKN